MTGSAAPPPPSFIRPALAMLAGLGVIVLIVGVGTIIATLGALRGVDPKTFEPSPVYRGVVIALTIFGAFAGGYTTSLVTASRSFFTVGLLALMLFVSGIVPVLRNRSDKPTEPRWYAISLAILSPLSVLAGGMFERRRMRAQALPPAAS